MVNGLVNQFALGAEPVINDAERFDDFADQTGFFGNFSKSALLDRFVALGVTLWHTPFQAVAACGSTNECDGSRAVGGQHKPAGRGLFDHSRPRLTRALIH